MDKKECVNNHLPEWIKELDNALSACMSIGDGKRELQLLTRYNELTDKENSDSEDAFSLYGVAEEKDAIIAEIISINERWRKEAEELKLSLEVKEAMGKIPESENASKQTKLEVNNDDISELKS